MDPTADISSMSAKALKDLIASAGLSFADCPEKADLQARAREARERLSAPSWKSNAFDDDLPAPYAKQKPKAFADSAGERGGKKDPFDPDAPPLRELKMSELAKRAAAAGVPADTIAEALDEANPKEVLATLIEARPRTNAFDEPIGKPKGGGIPSHTNRNSNAFDDEPNRKPSAFDEKPKNAFDDKPKSAFDDKPKNAFDNQPKSAFNDKPKNAFDDKRKGAFDDKPKNAFDDEPKNAFDDKPKNVFDDKPKGAFDDKPTAPPNPKAPPPKDPPKKNYDAERETKRWKIFVELAAWSNTIRMVDVPIPNTKEFSLQDLWLLGNDDFKVLAKRWHPDKFNQKYGSKLVPEEKEEVICAVKEFFQVLCDRNKK